jgi:hypothetical protein
MVCIHVLRPRQPHQSSTHHDTRQSLPHQSRSNVLDPTKPRRSHVRGALPKPSRRPSTSRQIIRQPPISSPIAARTDLPPPCPQSVLGRHHPPERFNSHSTTTAPAASSNTFLATRADPTETLAFPTSVSRAAKLKNALHLPSAGLCRSVPIEVVTLKHLWYVSNEITLTCSRPAAVSSLTLPAPVAASIRQLHGRVRAP